MRVSRFLQTSFLLAGLVALPSFAQTSADSNSSGAAPATGTTATNNNNYPQNREQDRGFNFGWLGLLGLAGLSGLRRRSHQDQPHTGDTRGMGTNRT